MTPAAENKQKKFIIDYAKGRNHEHLLIKAHEIAMNFGEDLDEMVRKRSTTKEGQKALFKRLTLDLENEELFELLKSMREVDYNLVIEKMYTVDRNRLELFKQGISSAHPQKIFSAVKAVFAKPPQSTL